MTEIYTISIPFLQLLAFLLGRWQYHGTIRTVYLKEDRILTTLLIDQIFLINQFLVLIIRKVVLHHDIEHCPGIGYGHTRLFGIGGQNFEIFRETSRQDAPDTICVQFQGTAGMKYQSTSTVYQSVDSVLNIQCIIMHGKRLLTQSVQRSVLL